MIVYKGLNKNLESVLGNGKKECCTLKPGVLYRESQSKTRRNGYHCCENPFECLSYYSLNGENRFFQAEAGGDINEDEKERIACTEITLVRELSLLEFAFAGMEYMINHPRRSRWQQEHENVRVLPDKAEAKKAGQIAIARGPYPRVRGPEGSILGLIVEPEPGLITEAKLFRGIRNVWMEMEEGRKLREVRDEEETG